MFNKVINAENGVKVGMIVKRYDYLPKRIWRTSIDLAGRIFIFGLVLCVIRLPYSLIAIGIIAYLLYVIELWRHKNNKGGKG